MRRDAKPAKNQAKRPVVRKSLQNDRDKIRQIQRRLGKALQREAEALEQQTQRRPRHGLSGVVGLFRFKTS
jgi:hypothetical protein